MIIFLIGYMGSGKTTLGKKIAAKLDYEFVDLDSYIENSYNKKISDIFKDEGEDRFREIEYECLKDFLNEEKIVLATGGGTPCFFNSMELMNKAGKTVYFNIPVDILVNRLRHAKEDRPLINGKTDEELREFILNMLAKRNRYYLQSQYIFNDRDLKVEQVIQGIERSNLL